MPIGLYLGRNPIPSVQAPQPQRISGPFHHAAMSTFAHLLQNHGVKPESQDYQGRRWATRSVMHTIS
jgi:hypothetical protein